MNIIQLDKKTSKALALSWNRLLKRKNYSVPNTLEKQIELGANYAPRLRIGSEIWFLSSSMVEELEGVVEKICAELKGVVSYKVAYEVTKQELELEISKIQKDAATKREFAEVLTSVQTEIYSKISSFDFYFAVEGLELEDIEEIDLGRVKIIRFNEELRNRLIDLRYRESDEYSSQDYRYTENFIDSNFLNCICIKSSAYGDIGIARKQAHKQARDTINYFRYIFCLLFYKRVAEQKIKINLHSEAYSNDENILVLRGKDNDVILTSSRGRKPSQTFPINQNLFQDFLSNGFLNEFSNMINRYPHSKTEIESCILTAVYWVGEAQNEPDFDMAFLKYWTALECIFTRNSEKPTHSLAKGVSTVITFISYSFIKPQDAEHIYKDMKKLYEKRSDIIHRGISYQIEESEISKICKYTAWTILSLFDLHSNGYRTMDEVDKDTERLYSRFIKPDGFKNNGRICNCYLCILDSALN